VLVTFPAASTIFTDPSEYDLSSTQYGGLFLPQVITAITAALLGAGLGGRFGVKRVYVVGLAAGLLSMVLLLASSLVTDEQSLAYGLLLLATASLGAGFGFTVPALNTPFCRSRSVLGRRSSRPSQRLSPAVSSPSTNWDTGSRPSESARYSTPELSCRPCTRSRLSSRPRWESGRLQSLVEGQARSPSIRSRVKSGGRSALCSGFRARLPVPDELVSVQRNPDRRHEGERDEGGHR
jgi:hypothetical protein